MGGASRRLLPGDPAPGDPVFDVLDNELNASAAVAYKWRMATVIVQGAFSFEAEERDRFVESSIEAMRSSRQEEVCLEYVIAADPLDPQRAVLTERWESMDHLEQHLAQQRNAPRDGAARPVPQGVEITLFEVATSRPLR